MLKYEEIAEDIKNRIESGEYRPNDQLPLEKEMCEKYGVSRITIKKAMDKLVMRGLVVKRRGAGTFVKDIDDKEVSHICRESRSDRNNLPEFFQILTGHVLLSLSESQPSPPGILFVYTPLHSTVLTAAPRAILPV